jgi:predicted lipid-binding transport protein (Tim44 family)
MRALLTSLLIGLMAFSFLTMDASAKRFGGGKSFGASRQASSFNKPNATSNTSNFQQAGAAAKPASTASKWLGPLAGLAAGGLLASLFMGHGLGSGIFSWLLIAGGAFFLWQFLRNRFWSSRQQQNNQTYQAQPQPQTRATNFTQQPFAAAANQANSDVTNQAIPSDFNEAEFLRTAKATFIRMQAAYDNKNLTDIREFTAPEIFAEVQLQIQERGNEENHTEVVSIDAELLDLSTAGQTIATVLFTGLVREQVGAEPVAIKEMWHFNKDLFRPVWIVTGIQQA